MRYTTLPIFTRGYSTGLTSLGEQPDRLDTPPRLGRLPVTDIAIQISTGQEQQGALR